MLTDVIDSECDFSAYKLVVAPMLYMIKPGVAERLTEFVMSGGTLVATYCAHELAALLHAEAAEVLGTYRGQFYSGRPALTVNRVGSGAAYYIASGNEQQFLDDLYDRLVGEARPRQAFELPLPDGVSATVRQDAEDADHGAIEYRFIMNFTTAEQFIPAPAEGEVVLYQSPTPNSGDPADAKRASANRQVRVDSARIAPYGVQVRRREL